MAQLNFPDPSDSTTYSAGGITWTWNATLGVWSTDADKNYVVTTQPPSPVEGSLWYDTTNKKLKVFTSNAWKAFSVSSTAADQVKYVTFGDTNNRPIGCLSGAADPAQSGNAFLQHPNSNHPTAAGTGAVQFNSNFNVEADYYISTTFNFAHEPNNTGIVAFGEGVTEGPLYFGGGYSVRSWWARTTEGGSANLWIKNEDGNEVIKKVTSRRSTKANIADATQQLALKILDLNPVSCNPVIDDEKFHNSDENPNRVFFKLIAEDVAEISPLFCEYDLDTGEPVQVRYDRLSGLMVKLLKSQRQEIADLENRLTPLEGGN